PEEEFDEFRAVSDHHGDALARRYAEASQHARDRIRPRVEPPIGRPPLVSTEQIDDRNFIRQPRHGGIEAKAEIAPTICVVHGDLAGLRRLSKCGARALRGDQPRGVSLLACTSDGRHPRANSVDHAAGSRSRGASRGADVSPEFVGLSTSAVTKKSHAFQISNRGLICALAERANRVTFPTPNHGRFLLYSSPARRGFFFGPGHVSVSCRKILIGESLAITVP